MPRRRHFEYVANSMISPDLRLWMLRILLPLNGHRNFVLSNGFDSDGIAHSLGLSEWIDPETFEFSAKAVRQQLRKAHADAERAQTPKSQPSALSKNIKRLNKLVGLSEVDSRILEFVVNIHSERILDETADYLGAMTSTKAVLALSVILNLPEPHVREALSANGTLSRCALVSLDRNGSDTLQGKLNLLSEQFADYIMTPDTDPVSLIRDTVVPSRSGHLSFADFAHIQHHLAILLPYLKKVRDSRRRGVNILLFGPPGTGKNQLSKAVAKALRLQLFEIASEDSDGDSTTGEQRLRAFKAAQHFFVNRSVLLLFDEVEDVFSSGEHSFFARPSVAQGHKAWINRMLEENPVPTLWLSNSISGLDPAFIRRFDLVIELPVPPQPQREQIARDAGQDLLDAATLSRLARCEQVTPAIIARAADVVATIRDSLTAAAIPGAIETLVSNTLEAQGYRGLRSQDPNALPEAYDPTCINASTDLLEITAGLKRASAGRLCLYGPPGTGKTAFARWLARQLGKPLLEKRASDLLSMWVGGTEQQIASAFREAEQSGAVLLIDEVDSFLQDRRGARHSWEVSHVNEMLTQMEAFAGIFIASTNLMSGLDPASLRRFDLKAQFDYLKPEQAWQLLLRYCQALAIPKPPARLRARLCALSVLTPGDFAAAARQSRFRRLADAAMLVELLEQECAVKEDGRRTPMGFLA